MLLNLSLTPMDHNRKRLKIFGLGLMVIGLLRLVLIFMLLNVLVSVGYGNEHKLFLFDQYLVVLKIITKSYFSKFTFFVEILSMFISIAAGLLLILNRDSARIVAFFSILLQSVCATLIFSKGQKISDLQLSILLVELALVLMIYQLPLVPKRHKK